MDMNQIAARVVGQATGPYQHTCGGCGATFTTDVRHPWFERLADDHWRYWDTESRTEPLEHPGDRGLDNLAHDCKAS